MFQLNIKSNGTVYDTYISTASGEELKTVRRIEFVLDLDHPEEDRLVLHFTPNFVKLDIEGEVAFVEQKYIFKDPSDDIDYVDSPALPK